jgi:hypothetical protein
MKTNELIDILGTNLEPVKRGKLRNTLMIALAVGALSASCLMLAILGLPADAVGGDYSGLKILTLGFTLGLISAGAIFLIGAARPGETGRKPLILIGGLFFALVSAGGAALVLAHPAAWSGMIFGPQWAACLICIPLFAAAPFASLIWALREGAPTNLMRTGAIAGLVAGALGAAVFAFHHPGGTIPFIALWYGGSILLCALFGAIIGPRLLRW